MMGLARRTGAAVVVLAVWALGPVFAQENLDQGKTPAQLYASDCAICHKSPNGLAKRLSPYLLDNFLRQHYTASRESASIISAYLRGFDRQPAPKRERKSKRKAKASKPQLPPHKPAGAKSSDAKPSKTKPSKTKASDAKPSETKPAESKNKASADKHEEAKATGPMAGEAKPSPPEPAASQAVDAKAEAPKASQPKSTQDSTDVKPDKSN